MLDRAIRIAREEGLDLTPTTLSGFPNDTALVVMGIVRRAEREALLKAADRIEKMANGKSIAAKLRKMSGEL